MYRVAPMKLFKLNQIRSVFVNDGVEGQSVTPRGGEVANVHVVVAGCLHLTPQQEGVLCGFRFFVVRLFDSDVLNLERNVVCFSF